MFTTRRVVVVDGDRRAAEMLHTFFRLMELECSLVPPGSDVVTTVRQQRPDILILDRFEELLRLFELMLALG